MASVLASRASTPSSTELHMISAGEDRAAPGHEGQRRPVGQQHRADRADQRGNAIEPDAHLRARQAERRGGFDRGRLQPVDADRLLVADVVLEADVDEIAGLDHLLGRLREPRLVAIDRRDVEKAGQEQQQAAQNSRNAIARTWLPVTKSITPTSRLPGFTRFFGSRGSPNRGRA